MKWWSLLPEDYIQEGNPVEIDGEVYTKYRVPSKDDRTLWCINNYEVFYSDERLYSALDKIQEMEGK